jgi:hypothetical protein
MRLPRSSNSFPNRSASERWCFQGKALAVLRQLDLNAIEQPRIDNRRVLARIALAAMIDLAEIHPIAQEMVQRPIGQRHAANRLACRETPRACDGS